MPPFAALLEPLSFSHTVTGPTLAPVLTVQRSYDEDLYKLSHLVEDAFFYLKQWRGIAHAASKNSKSFLTAVHIRCLAPWFKIS